MTLFIELWLGNRIAVGKKKKKKKKKFSMLSGDPKFCWSNLLYYRLLWAERQMIHEILKNKP